MKHLTAAVIILLLIISGSYLCIAHTNTVATKIISSLDMCEKAVTSENWIKAKENSQKAISIWDKNKRFFSFYLHHDDLDKITDLLIEVSEIISEKDKEMFKIENKRLKALVDDIRNMDTLTFENLF